MTFLYLEKNDDDCYNAMLTLLAVLRRLDFAINYSKLECPSQILIFLGFDINTLLMTFSLPKDKLSAFTDLIHKFLEKKRSNKKQLEVLIGKLNWASQVVCGCRTFLRRLITLKDSLQSYKYRVLLDFEYFEDLKWWDSFMSRFNGTCIIRNSTVTSLQTDACAVGGGIFCG